jgi:hypothetical protein
MIGAWLPGHELSATGEKKSICFNDLTVEKGSRTDYFCIVDLNNV